MGTSSRLATVRHRPRWRPTAIRSSSSRSRRWRALRAPNRAWSRLASVGSLAGRLLAAVVFASVATSAGAAGAASGATYAKGVDVSHWNGPIDWLSVASASHRFAYAKATEGKTIVDVTYP